MSILKIWNVNINILIPGLRFLVQICQQMGKPYEEYNAQFSKLKRAQEAEEARFTDFNQGENYFNRQPDPQMNQPSGYQIQEKKRQEAEDRRSEQQYGAAPSNRDNGRLIKGGGGGGNQQNDDFDDNDWGDDADDMLPD